MDEATQKLVDEAVAKARAEALAEASAMHSAVDAWINAHPLIAFRCALVVGVILGGFTVYGLLRVLG